MVESLYGMIRSVVELHDRGVGIVRVGTNKGK